MLLWLLLLLLLLMMMMPLPLLPWLLQLLLLQCNLHAEQSALTRTVRPILCMHCQTRHRGLRQWQQA